MRNILITIMLGAGLVLTGCTTVDPYTREEKTSSATKGAGIGAATGAVLGILSGDDSRERRKRAVIGAGVGAIAGGGVGYYMDVQEAKLRERLDGSGVSVVRDGDNVILNMPSNITFEVDRAEVQADFKRVLEDVTLVLDEYEKTLIEVVGHTDSTGSDRYNQLLSERRADAVANYLMTTGVEPVRIAVAGYGEEYPIASNDSDAGRQANRRVELTLVPVTQ